MSTHSSTPQPAESPAQGRPWPVALAVLAAIACAGVIFATGLVTGFVAGRATAPQGASPAGQPSPTAPSESAPPAGTGEETGGTGEVTGGPGEDPGGAQEDADAPDPDLPADASGPIDPCLVGQWRTTEHRESFSTEQGEATLTGLVRLVEIDEAGRQTITYDQAPAVLSTDQGQGSAIFDGTVVYQASTSGSTMSFQLLSAEGNITLELAGASQEQALQPGAGDVSYTCDESAFTQEASGFSASYERAG